MRIYIPYQTSSSTLNLETHYSWDSDERVRFGGGVGYHCSPRNSGYNVEISEETTNIHLILMVNRSKFKTTVWG